MNLHPMNPVDAAWWRMDTPTNRMTIVAVLGFDRPFSAGEFVTLLEEKLSAFPRFRLRVTSRRGRPHWEEDPEFAFANHVSAVANAPEDPASLKVLIGTLMGAAFPSERPPWEFAVVESYQGGSAVVARLHHAIADGLALIHVLRNLSDDVVGKPTELAPKTSVDAGRAGWGRHLWATIKSLPGLASALFKFAVTGADRTTRLRGVQGEEKRVDWSATVDLGSLRKTAVHHSATINDVLLAVISGGLRRYLERFRALSERFELRAIIPVNLRHRHEGPSLGNRFGLVILALPVGLRNLAARIGEVHKRMLDARLSMEPKAALQVLSAIGRAPKAVEDVAVKKLSATSSAAITHVPGPRKHLVLAGRTLKDLMFWVPRGGSVGMGISILTYAGKARIGLATDARLVPDPDALALGIDKELGELGLA